MSVKFKPSSSSALSNVKYIYWGAASAWDSSVPRRVGMAVYKNPGNGQIYYPYRLPYPIINNISGATINQTQFLFGKTLQVRITPDSGESVPLTVEGVGCYGSYTPSDSYGTYTITGAVGGTPYILLNGSTRSYNLTVTVTNGSSTAGSKLAAVGTTRFKILPNSGYTVPESITIGGSLESYSYNANTGQVSLTTPATDITVSAACVAGVQVLAKDVVHGKVSINDGTASATAKAWIKSGASATFKFVPDSGYVVPDLSDIDYGATSGYSYDSASYNAVTGTLTIFNITGTTGQSGSNGVWVSATFSSSSSQLPAPLISIDGDMLTVPDTTQHTAKNEIYINGTEWVEIDSYTQPLRSPTVVIDGSGYLNITATDPNTEHFDIYVDGVKVRTILNN